MSHFCTKIPFRVPYYIDLSCLPRLLFLGCDRFSDFVSLSLFLFFSLFDNFDMFEQCWSSIFRMPFYWNFFNVSLMIRLRLWVFWEEDHRCRMPFSSHGMTYQHDNQHDLSLLVLMLTSITQLTQYLSGFSTLRLFFPSSLSILYSLEGSHHVQPTLKEADFWVYWNFCTIFIFFLYI